jgi:predicted secreted protein
MPTPETFMDPVLAAAVYFVIWWTVLFAVLPFAGRSQQEAGEVVAGTPASAPSRPRLLRVAGITSAVSAVLLLVLWLVMGSGLLGGPPAP